MEPDDTLPLPPPVPAWRPTPLIAGSAGLHALALDAVVAQPGL